MTIVAIALALLPLLAAPTADPVGLSAYRADLEARTQDGAWWWTSNAAYAETDGASAPDAFGLHLRAGPDGVSATGCLWTIRDGEPDQVMWIMHEGWVFTDGAPFFYQAHASGSGSGMGRGMERDGGAIIFDQTFAWSDGSTQQIRHRAHWEDADTHVTESLVRVDGRWEPNRSYAWTRRPAGPTPCDLPRPTPPTRSGT